MSDDLETKSFCYDPKSKRFKTSCFEPHETTESQESQETSESSHTPKTTILNQLFRIVKNQDSEYDYAVCLQNISHTLAFITDNKDKKEILFPLLRAVTFILQFCNNSHSPSNTLNVTVCSLEILRTLILRFRNHQVCREPEFDYEFSANNLIDLVYASMLKYPLSGEIQYLGCYMMPYVMHRSKYHHTAVKIAVHALQNFKFDRAIQESAFKTVIFLCPSFGTVSSRDLEHLNVVNEILNTFRYITTSSVTILGLEALHSLVCFAEETKELIRNHYGIQRIVSCMNLHPDSDGVQQMALKTLQKLIQNDGVNTDILLLQENFKISFGNPNVDRFGSKLLSQILEELSKKRKSVVSSVL